MSKIIDPFAYLDSAPQGSGMGGGGIVDPFAYLDGPEPEPPEPESRWSQAGRGFKAGIDQTIGLGGALTATVGATTGNEAMTDWGMGVYERSTERAEAHGGKIKTIADVKGVGDAVDYVLYGTGNAIAQFLPSLAMGGVGGVAGREIAKRKVKDIIESEMVNGKTAREAAEAATSYVIKGQVAGGTGAGLVASVGLNTGAITAELHEEFGEVMPGVAWSFGAVAGAVDLLPVMRVLDTLGLGRDARRQISRSAVKEIAKTGATEGLTELVQEIIAKSAVKYVDSNKDIFTKQNMLQMVDAGLFGTFGGTAIGGAAEVGRGVFGPGEQDIPRDRGAPGGNLDRQRAMDGEAQAAAEQAKAEGGDTLDALLAEQAVYEQGEAAASAFRPDQFDPIATTNIRSEYAPGMQSPASIDPATGQPVEGRGNWLSDARRRFETGQAIEQAEQEIEQALGQRDQQRQQRAMDQSWRGIPGQTPIEGFGGSDLVPGADQTPGSFGRTGQPQQTDVLSADLDGTGRLLVGDGTQDELYSRRLAEALEREEQGMARVRDEAQYQSMGMGRPESEPVVDPEGYEPGPGAREQVDQAQIAELEKLYEDTRKEMPEREKGGQKIANVDMDVLQYIVAKGGVSLTEGKERGFDSGDTKKQIGGFNRVFTTKGKTFDDMAQSMAEDGFFQGRDYTANELEDMVRRSLGGELIFSPRSNKAGLTAAVKNDLAAIESALEDVKGKRNEEITDPPKGKVWQSESDAIRQLTYTVTEAEAIGVPQADIDRVLDASATPEAAETALRKEIELEKQFRGFWFGTEAESQGSAEGPDAAQSSQRPETEGRGQEATAAEVGAQPGAAAPTSALTQEATAAERLTAAQTRRNQAEADKDVNAMIDAGGEASAALIEGIQAEMDAGRMPVIQDGSLYHAIHPSTSRPGKLQITTYNDTGALSDTTVDDMDGVQRELNASKARVMPTDEASETMNRIGLAEAEYQQRRQAFDLAQETEQQRTTREQTQRETQAKESAAATQAEQRAQADADVGEFSLTGSDRQSDANPNQGDLLGADTTRGQDAAPATEPSNVRTLRDAQEKKAAERAAAKLNDITISETMLDDSGNEVTVEQSAAVALRQLDKRLKVLDDLLGCVKGST